MRWIAGRSKTTAAILSACIFIALAGCGGGVLGDSDTLATDVFELTNQERTNAGLGSLAWNDTLAQVAEAHAIDMATRNYFAHNSPEGEDVGDRASHAGYTWLWIGENIAMGQTTAEQVVQGWMASPGHRENILRNGFAETGIACYQADSWGPSYWAQVFGTPMPAPW